MLKSSQAESGGHALKFAVPLISGLNLLGRFKT